MTEKINYKKIKAEIDMDLGYLYEAKEYLLKIPFINQEVKRCCLTEVENWISTLILDLKHLKEREENET